MKKSYLILSRLLDLYSTRRIYEEAQKIYNTQVFHPESSELLTWKEESVTLPRLGVFRFQESLLFLEKCSALRFVNPLQEFARARNKALTYYFLKENHLPTPSTYILENFSPEKIDLHVQELEKNGLKCGDPLVIKKINSSQGRGIYLAKTESELKDILILNFATEKKVVIQKMHSECWGKDLRIFSCLDKNWAMTRQSTNGDFRSNLSLGGIGGKTLLTQEEEDLAQKTLHLFGLQYAGIDFLRTKNGPLILEVNPCPGLEGIEKICSANIAHHIVRLRPNQRVRS